jgi:hypothetical protein
MSGHIRIEIQPAGETRVFIGQPREDEDADVVWRLYRVLKPEIDDLKKAARKAGAMATLPFSGSG